MSDQVRWGIHLLKSRLQHGVDRGFHAEFIGVKLKRPSPDSTISAESLTDSFVEAVKSGLQVNPKNIRRFHFVFEKVLFLDRQFCA